MSDDINLVGALDHVFGKENVLVIDENTPQGALEKFLASFPTVKKAVQPEEGDRVRLKPQPDENQPEQFGVVVDMDCLNGGLMYVILIDKKYRDKNDDGIREVSHEFVEKAE
jgi:hypothetical protein